MEPTTPVVFGLEQFEVKYGEAQEEYATLPALIGGGPCFPVISRWVPTDTERQQIMDGADIYVIQSTYGGGLQPTSVAVGGYMQDSNAFMQTFGVGNALPEKNVQDVLDSVQS